eukprot:7705991-Pyramimonas_sp.AAC.1
MDLVQPMVGVQLDEHQPLMEYGIDSRRAMELCDAIEDSLGVRTATVQRQLKCTDDGITPSVNY